MEIRTLFDTATDLVGSLTPCLIGSAVAQAWKPDVPFRQRFIHWVLGSTISVYAAQAVSALTGSHGFIAQFIGFGLGLIAVDATPRLSRAVIDTLTSLPARIADRFLPKKD